MQSISPSVPDSGPSFSQRAPQYTPHKHTPLLHGKSAGARHKSKGRLIDNNILDTYLDDARTRIDQLYDGLWQYLKDNRSIQEALNEFRQSVSLAQSESYLYEPLDDFLNAISSVVVQYAAHRDFPLPGKVIWFRAHDDKLHGDFMNEATKPDRRCAIGELAVKTQENAMLQTPWQKIAGVGEDKFRCDGRMGQLKSYMVDHLKYRVDYPVVRAFALDKIGEKFRLRLTALNSHGFWCSPRYAIGALEPWIAHVCEVYEADVSKIKSIRPIVEQTKTGETRVFHQSTLFGREMVVAPVYAKSPPGRTTFVGFILNPDTDNDGSIDPTEPNQKHSTLVDAYETRAPVGAFKVSWHHTKEACHEKQMYDAAHGNATWNPGLARPEFTERLLDYSVQSPGFSSNVPGVQSPDPDLTASGAVSDIDPEVLSEESDLNSDAPGVVSLNLDLEVTGVNGYLRSDAPGVMYPGRHPETGPITLYPEVITLRSFGEPLSQCRTPRELLEVIYDTCLTLEDLYVANVLHRDISGRNIMCHPVHTSETGDREVLQRRRCINFVLNGTQSDYKCLVMDLDHATRLVRPAAHQTRGGPTTEKTGTHQRTGTPMFMALDLLDVPRRRYEPDDFRRNKKGIPRCFAPAKSSPSAKEAFARAFSSGAAEAHGYRDAEHLNLYDETWLRDRLAALHRHFDSTFFRPNGDENTKIGGDEDEDEDEDDIGTAFTYKPNATPSSNNQLRHDVESCLWVLYYYLARAIPLAAGTETQPMLYRTFVDSMLREDGTGEAKHAASKLVPSDVLHPDLEKLGIVVEALRDYLLTVPWQKMEEDSDFPDDLRLHPAHAAVVMRRILLNALTHPFLREVLNIELCIAYPRDPCLLDSDYAQRSFTQSADASHSSIKPRASSEAGSNSSINKRRAETRGEDPPAKRRKTVPSTTANTGSAQDLAQMIWRDLMWYSPGPLKE